MSTIILDVNTTALDYSAASYKFVQLFQAQKSFKRWITLMQEIPMVEGHTFESKAMIAMGELEKEEQVYVVEEEKQQLLDLLLQSPAYENTKQILTMLRNTGREVVGMLNTENKHAIKQLLFSGLDDAFDSIVCAADDEMASVIKDYSAKKGKTILVTGNVNRNPLPAGSPVQVMDIAEVFTLLTEKVA